LASFLERRGKVREETYGLVGQNRFLGVVDPSSNPNSCQLVLHGGFLPWLEDSNPQAA
jgi:hypothetical protein